MTFDQATELIELLNQIIEIINEHGDNLAKGLYFLMQVAAVYFVILIIKMLYKLFNNVYLGGL